MKNEYDFGIIGAGGTGLAAAMYPRASIKTICRHSHGSECRPRSHYHNNAVENYPGFIRLMGRNWRIVKEARFSYDLVTKRRKVIEVKKKIFSVIKQKRRLYSKTLLIATGTKWRKLNVPGSKELENRGVAYCALCDSPLYKNKTVAVVGGSDSAVKDALVLAEHAKHVYIIYRGEQIHPEPINFKRVQQNKKIEVINNTNILEIKGKDVVDSVILDKPFKGSKELKLNGVFVAIGHIFLSDLAKPLGVKLNEKGEIIIDHKTSETNIPGIFAAGDVADKPFKQSITGVAEGCTAAYSAYEYITKQKIANS